MIFNSFEFLLFFPLVALLYFLMPHQYRALHLLLASCIFYMAFIPTYILLLLALVLLDYGAGILIERTAQPKKKSIYLASISIHLCVLFFFKYFNFFSESINEALSSFGLTTSHLPYLHLILPLALSFHTLRSISYLIEIYRGKMSAERNFIVYASSALFFPQLINGPIEKPYALIPQFKENHLFNTENLLTGLRLMLWGFFKKVVIADRLALYVNTVYQHPHDFHAYTLSLAVLFFSVQLYCDFSGYTDIAIGSARILGFRLSPNFNKPFRSKSMAEFWRRWHITLTVWYNDYLFKPIFASMSSLRDWSVVIALLTTFLLSGLWHGAQWTFLAYGLLHGSILVYEYLTRNFRLKLSLGLKSGWVSVPSMITVFILITFSWIFFRAQSISDSIYVIRELGHFWKTPLSFSAFLLPSFGYTNFILSILFIALLIIIHMLIKGEIGARWDNAYADIAFCSIILSLILIFGTSASSMFIYSKL